MAISAGPNANVAKYGCTASFCRKRIRPIWSTSSPVRHAPRPDRHVAQVSPHYRTPHSTVLFAPKRRATFLTHPSPPAAPQPSRAMLPYSAGDHRRSPPPRAAFSSSLPPSAAPFPAADPGRPDRDLPSAPSVYAADWGNTSWIEPPVSYMAPAAAPSTAAPGYKGKPLTLVTCDLWMIDAMLACASRVE
jgi:hypothetical protein